jgi:hypothetical protein
MLRKSLRVIGWIAAGLVTLCVVAYLAALAINWHDQPPNATAIRLAQMFRDRPAIADEDNAYAYLRQHKFDRDRRKLSPRLQKFLEACAPGEPTCASAFDAADGLLEEWQAAESSLLDYYLAFTAHAGWFETESSNILDSIPSFAGVGDGQKLLLLRARQLAIQGDAQAVRSVLERDLQFWRRVQQSSDILVSKMIATAALNRHFEWGYRVLRKLPAEKIGGAIPDGWRSGVSEAERSMVRCIVGEWMFVSELLEDMASNYRAGEDATTFDRVLGRLSRPLMQLQDSKNRTADHYWAVAQTLEAPFTHYEAALRRADELNERTTDEAATFRIYNRVGVAGLANLSSFSTYAARVSDIEGTRRAVLLAATLRASGTAAEHLPTTVASAELRNPYTDRPFDWDEARGAIVFRGLETGERGEHVIYY